MIMDKFIKQKLRSEVKMKELSWSEDNKLKKQLIELTQNVTKDVFQTLTISTLYDPHQTHSISPIKNSDVDELKKELRKHKVNKFRKVKLKQLENSVILCFNAEKFV